MSNLIVCFTFSRLCSFSGESATFRCGLSRGNVSRLSISWYKRAENAGQDELIDKNKDSLSLTVRGHLKYGTQSSVAQYRCTVKNTDGIGSSPLARLVILRRGNNFKRLCVAHQLRIKNKLCSVPL